MSYLLVTVKGSAYISGGRLFVVQNEEKLIQRTLLQSIESYDLFGAVLLPYKIEYNHLLVFEMFGFIVRRGLDSLALGPLHHFPVVSVTPIVVVFHCSIRFAFHCF